MKVARAHNSFRSMDIKAVIDKLFYQDDIGRLTTVVAWNILVSLVPITVGLTAISAHWL